MAGVSMAPRSLEPRASSISTSASLARKLGPSARPEATAASVAGERRLLLPLHHHALEAEGVRPRARAGSRCGRARPGPRVGRLRSRARVSARSRPPRRGRRDPRGWRSRRPTRSRRGRASPSARRARLGSRRGASAPRRQSASPETAPARTSSTPLDQMPREQDSRTASKISCTLADCVTRTKVPAWRILARAPYGASAEGPGGWKKRCFMRARSAKFTTPSPFRSASGSLLKKTAFSLARSEKLTTPSLFRSGSQALP